MDDGDAQRVEGYQTEHGPVEGLSFDHAADVETHPSLLFVKKGRVLQLGTFNAGSGEGRPCQGKDGEGKSQDGPRWERTRGNQARHCRVPVWNHMLHRARMSSGSRCQVWTLPLGALRGCPELVAFLEVQVRSTPAEGHWGSVQGELFSLGTELGTHRGRIPTYVTAVTQGEHTLNRCVGPDDGSVIKPPNHKDHKEFNPKMWV